MQYVARRLVTFGLHVHVGVDSGDKAIQMCDRLLRHLPTLLALSANSPFFAGRDTGLLSYRSKLLEALPTAGMPHTMRNWSEYCWLAQNLVSTGFIQSIREIWWDVRPHHDYGTVEIRIMDQPMNMDHLLGLVAITQALVAGISADIDKGAYLYDCHPHDREAEQVARRAIRDGCDVRGFRHDAGHPGPPGDLAADRAVPAVCRASRQRQILAQPPRYHHKRNWRTPPACAYRAQRQLRGRGGVLAGAEPAYRTSRPNRRGSGENRSQNVTQRDEASAPVNENNGSTKGSTAVKTRPAPPVVRQLPPWNVLLHNDDVNDMMYVINTIVELTSLNRHDAMLRMLDAHTRGITLLITTHREHAELLDEQFQSKRLTVTIEPAP